MQARWLRLRLRIPAWVEDAMVLFLVERGIPGVQVEETQGDRVLIAYFPEGISIDDLKEEVRLYISALAEIQGGPVSFAWEIDSVLDEAWAEAWKVHFHPTRISPRFVVKPSWEEYDPPQGTVVLQIDPGQAFGTGLHATTRMILHWVERILDEEEEAPPAAALDVGTGTGILAVALAKLGVGAVWALDIDPLATEAARVNARINGVEDRVRVLEGSVEVIEGRAFPLVVANLTGPLLVQMARGLTGCVAPRGWLLVSGMLAEEKDTVLETYTRAGLVPAGFLEQDTWYSLAVRRETWLRLPSGAAGESAFISDG